MRTKKKKVKFKQIKDKIKRGKKRVKMKIV